MSARCSVLIACYNARSTLRRTVLSALAQGESVKDVIVIDDGSTDGSTQALADIHDDRLRIVRQTENRGQGAALNAGLDRAQGDFVLELDADDWLPRRSVARLLRAAKRCPSATVGLYSDRRIWTPTRRGLRSRRLWKGFHYRGRYPFIMRMRRLPPGPRFLNRKALVDAGGWPLDDPTRGRLYADLLVWLRLLGIGELHYVPGISYHVRRHRGSLSRSNRRSWPLLRDLAIAQAAEEWDDPLRPVFGRTGLRGFSSSPARRHGLKSCEVHVEIVPAPSGALTDAGDTRASLAVQTLPPASIQERERPSRPHEGAAKEGTTDRRATARLFAASGSRRYLLTVQAGVWLRPTALERLVERCPLGGAVAPRLLSLGPSATSPFTHRSSAANPDRCVLRSLNGTPSLAKDKPATYRGAGRASIGAGFVLLGGITLQDAPPANPLAGDLR